MLFTFVIRPRVRDRPIQCYDLILELPRVSPLLILDTTYKANSSFCFVWFTFDSDILDAFRNYCSKSPKVNNIIFITKVTQCSRSLLSISLIETVELVPLLHLKNTRLTQCSRFLLYL